MDNPMFEEVDKSTPKKNKGLLSGNSKLINIVLISFGILFFAGLVIVGLKFTGFLGGKGVSVGAKMATYRTLTRVEVHENAKASSDVKAVLKEGTIVSGKNMGSVDGVEWAQITSVDGARGFLPLSSLSKIGDGTDLSQVQDSPRKIVTSTSVNIRSTPSLSGAIIGTIDGGTRISTDGYVSSQGEDWLRMRIGRDQTGFIMARFTTPDDDSKNGKNGFASSKIGAPGIVKTVTNVQATPFPDGRVIRALLVDDRVGILGQTKTDDWWYIIRLDDGTQGFIPKSSVSLNAKEGKWVYPDGSIAPGPNIPQSPVAKSANTVNSNSSSSGKAPSAASGVSSVEVDLSAPAIEPASVPNPEAPQPPPSN
jgi:uncharacterized protein YgiM (DUF1202 family)